MADMVCGLCGEVGIRWVGWRFNNFTHTECPHCGGTDCHVGQEEGDLCRRDGCCGRLEIRPDGECSCHIRPPCGACENAKLACSDCDWEEE